MDLIVYHNFDLKIDPIDRAKGLYRSTIVNSPAGEDSIEFILLAVAFLAHGWLFLSPPAEMVEMMNAQIGVGLVFLLAWRNCWRRLASSCPV